MKVTGKLISAYERGYFRGTFTGKILSFLYENCSLLKKNLYYSGLLPEVSLPALTISVGNISAGGGGKSPVVVELARWFSREGRKVAVLSRGFMPDLKKRPVTVVSDGRKIQAGVDEAGDEAVMMAFSLLEDEVAVISGKDRVLGGQYAIEKLGADTIILDDAFQYWRLRRDVDIVALEPACPFGNDRIIPEGILRERSRALERADFIVVTRANLVDGKVRTETLRAIQERLTGLQKNPVLYLAGFVRSSAQEEQVRGLRALAVCGLARPEYFMATLKRAGYDVIAKRFYEDHHIYEADDIRDIVSLAALSRAEVVVTTAKDEVKIRPLWRSRLPLHIIGGRARLEESFFKRVEELATSRFESRKK